MFFKKKKPFRQHGWICACGPNNPVQNIHLKNKQQAVFLDTSNGGKEAIQFISGNKYSRNKCWINIKSMGLFLFRQKIGSFAQSCFSLRQGHPSLRQLALEELLNITSNKSRKTSGHAKKSDTPAETSQLCYGDLLTLRRGCFTTVNTPGETRRLVLCGTSCNTSNPLPKPQQNQSTFSI